MEETENKLQWTDLIFPCDLLVHAKNVEGVTQNPVFQVQAMNSTLNRDFIFLRGIGWIKSSEYELIEEIVAPVNPQPEMDSSQGKPSKE